MIDTLCIATAAAPPTLWEEALSIWRGGGWSMAAIAVTAFGIFALGMSVYLRLLGKGFTRVPERTWRRWITHPDERRGAIGAMLDEVTDAISIEEMTTHFEQLRSTEIRPFERDLRLMRIGVSAAPLLGLLGTVMGMLTTFAALSTGAGGDKTMALVASGISEALITTETGLVVALAGLFFQYQLSRRHARYAAFIAHLESVCVQHLYRTLHAGDAGNEPGDAPSESAPDGAEGFTRGRPRVTARETSARPVPGPVAIG